MKAEYPVELIEQVQNFMRLWNWLLRPGTASREIIYDMMEIAKVDVPELAASVRKLKEEIRKLP